MTHTFTHKQFDYRVFATQIGNIKNNDIRITHIVFKLLFVAIFHLMLSMTFLNIRL